MFMIDSKGESFLMPKEKNMLLPLAFFTHTWLLIDFLAQYDLEPYAAYICKTLDSIIQSKLNAIDKREAFSKYKSETVGSDKREELRLAYLELAGIHRDWVSSVETPMRL
jgi:hypothetical protein